MWNTPIVDQLNRYRGWFYAAAAYNLAWGALVVLWPGALFQWIGMTPPTVPPIFQSVGMMVGVYALGYWLIARDPVRFGPFVYIGLLGKLLGPIGFVDAAIRGTLPWSFGWINVFNDVIWLPAFIGFTLALRRYEESLRGSKSRSDNGPG